MPRLITVSLIEGFFCFVFFFVFFLEGAGGGGLWSYVHHTVDVKILCSDVVRPSPSGCPFIFSVHAIFDDPVKIIWWQLPSTLMPFVHVYTGSIMLFVMLSVRQSGCLSVCLSVCPSYISICHLTSRVRSISPSPVKAFLQLPDSKMICRMYRYY